MPAICDMRPEAIGREFWRLHQQQGTLPHAYHECRWDLARLRRRLSSSRRLTRLLEGVVARVEAETKPVRRSRQRR
jgi:hypothetical protein